MQNISDKIRLRGCEKPSPKCFSCANVINIHIKSDTLPDMLGCRMRKSALKRVVVVRKPVKVDSIYLVGTNFRENHKFHFSHGFYFAKQCFSRYEFVFFYCSYCFSAKFRNFARIYYREFKNSYFEII